MSKPAVGNAPCSWGSLEFAGFEGEIAGYQRVLDEMAETGYTGTELGDWGFMPTDPSVLKQELNLRKLVMLGGFLPVELRNPAAHAKGIAEAVKIATLLAQVATRPQPYLVLADNNCNVAVRTQNAGRVQPEMGLSDSEWKIFAQGAIKIAQAVRDQTGLQTVFHHHCGGFVETPEEITRLLDLTPADLLNLVFDTGHYAYGANSCDVMAGLRRFEGRVQYMHFKDCHPDVAQSARAQGWDYFQAIQRGVFCELGQGCVDFPAVLAWLEKWQYQGYILVEQDVLPGMGTPKDSAHRNREYLRKIGL
jgi:inosose dehydratase